MYKFKNNKLRRLFKMSQNGKFLYMDHENHLIFFLHGIRNNIPCCEQFVRYCRFNTKFKETIHKKLKTGSKDAIRELLNVLTTGCLYNMENRETILECSIDYYAIQILKSTEIIPKLYCQALRLLVNVYAIRPDPDSNYVEIRNNRYSIDIVKNLNFQQYDAMQLHFTILHIRLIYILWKYWSWHDLMIKNMVPRFVVNLYSWSIKKSSINVRYVKITNMTLVTMGCICHKLEIVDPKMHKIFIRRFIGHDYTAIKYLLQRYIEQNKLAIIILERVCDMESYLFIEKNFGTVSEIIAQLESGTFSSANTLKENVAKLCLLSKKCKNRPEFESKNGIKLIIKLLQNSQDQRCTLMLLQTIWHFLYDTPIVSLIKEGVLNFFLPKVISFITDENKFSYIQKYDQCFYNMSKVMTCRCSQKHNHHSLFYLLESYKNINIEMEDMKYLHEENSDTMQQYNVITVHNRITNREDDYIPTDLYFIFVCLKLLDRLTNSTEFINWLVSPIVIKPLLMYANHLKGYPNVILKRIIQKKMYFTSVMERGYVLDIQCTLNYNFYMNALREKAKTNDCVLMLSSILQQGEEQAKLNTAFSILFLIDSISILNKLLCEHGALQLIFDVLKYPSHYSYKRAVLSLFQLAKQLRIDPNAKEYFVNNQNLEIYKDDLKQAPKVKLTFVDGTIEINKDILYQHSDIFPLIISNLHSETTKDTLNFKNMSKDGMARLMLAITDGNSSSSNNEKIESLMDALQLADIYKMPVIQQLTTIFINILNHETFVKAWNWSNKQSIESFQKDLCVKVFLTKISLEDATIWLNILYMRKDLEQFLHYIKETIMKILANT